MNCKKCGSLIKENAKFCGKCGAKVLPPERRCHSCNTMIDVDELFCCHCGKRFNENTISTSAQLTEITSSSQSESINEDINFNLSPIKSGFLLEKTNTLRFKKNITDREKKVIKKFKKDNQNPSALFLYDEDNNKIYIRCDENKIGVFSPDDTLLPITKYSVSSSVWEFWENTPYKPQHFYFFNGVDAFFAWDGYLFISVYQGEIRWTAADRRDRHYLPTQTADEDMFGSGVPVVKVLSNGIFTCKHFFDGKKFKVEKGVLILIE